ncbi:NUDIX domain-containing protein [Streptomyces actuosus]|uniref:NUDIX domain-containing protein n=1 Tax=Streptomyces actuosus TaxID=1885 RepID=A0ABS2VY92_STRAS|nr:NUDIX domain-containing protein [Streptomyces actuosus]MBN0047865.1 NUDIX domain-containing protein [Streptomyces actuosus]
MTAKKRRTSRVLVVDDHGRLLLMCGRDPRREGTRWWYTVGGEVENGEDPIRAALRETREETGLDLAPARLGPLLWTRRALFTWDGRVCDQYEEYRLVRVTGGEADRMRIDADEAPFGYAWWTVPELASTAEAVRPKGLATLLPRALAGRPPGEGPLHLGDFDEDRDPG